MVPSSWLIRTLCGGGAPSPLPHQGDSNVKEGISAGVGKKKMRTNNKGAAALFMSFEQWIFYYGKVYLTEAEKARRFKYFKDNKVHVGEDSLELDQFAADSPKEQKKKKKEADDAALFRSFEQWMAEYGKVYPTEAQKARRFKYFKDTVVCIEDYNKAHRGEDSLELDEFAADSPKEQRGIFKECYIPLSRLDQRFFGTNNKGAGKRPLPHQGDSNGMEEENFSGTVKKETLITNNNSKMEADEAALFSSFEKWMAEYGKVYRNETEKGWRFESFRAAVRKVEYYKEKYGKGASVLNEFSAEFPGESFIRCRGYTLLPHALGDSNVKEGISAGVGKKKMRTNNKGAGKMTLLRWFEQWMAEYGKVYPNEADKALRFKYFKKTVRTGKYYNEKYGEGEFVLNEFAAESPKEWLVRFQPCTLSPHVIDQMDPIVRKYLGVRKII